MGWIMAGVDIHKVIKKLLHRFYIVLSTYLWKTKNGLRSLLRRKPALLFLCFVSPIGGLFLVEHSVYLFHDNLWRDVLHAGEISTHAWLVAIDAARAARQVELHGIGWVLVPSHEASVWMGGAPDAHHRCIDKRSQVHIGAVHAYHHVQVTHEDEFLGESA